jgi:hypothetical protein
MSGASSNSRAGFSRSVFATRPSRRQTLPWSPASPTLGKPAYAGPGQTPTSRTSGPSTTWLAHSRHGPRLDGGHIERGAASSASCVTRQATTLADTERPGSGGDQRGWERQIDEPWSPG